MQVSAEDVKNRRIFVKFGMRRKLWLWYDKRNLKRGASVKDIKAAGGDIMLRIALCDDEQEARDQLRFQLENPYMKRMRKLYMNSVQEKLRSVG